MTHLLKMDNIFKSFSGVNVLNNVSFELLKGETHALLGENGAGKSTLIKILGGIYTKDSGTINIDGVEVDISNVHSATENGISIIHQELMLVPYLTIAENIFLGKELKRYGLIDQNEMVSQSRKFIEYFNLDLNPEQKVEDLTIAQQQMVEIIRAISFGAKIIVMDEPTTSLTESEVDTLFKSIEKLNEDDVGIIYISHRMSELEAIADRVTVLRDGEYIDTLNIEETTNDKLVELMVGRQLDDLYLKNNNSTEETILEVKNLSSEREVKDVSFTLNKGEVLGFSGLVGAGRSETMNCIFGLREIDNGAIFINNEKINIKVPTDAIDAGIGYVPEDRKNLGIYPTQGVRFNATIEVLPEFLRYGRYDIDKEIELTRKYVDDIMKTKYNNLEQDIETLSGGNQQKVIISRWLLATRSVLILDEPTKGIDIGAKSDIYSLINKLTEQGLSIILISSELPELINMSDRIVVMSNGYTTGILTRDEFSQEKIMTLSTKEVRVV